MAELAWGYALFWFLVEHHLKLAAYRLFDWRQPGVLATHLRPKPLTT